MNRYRHTLLRAFHENETYYELWQELRAMVSSDHFINPVVQTDATLQAVLYAHEYAWVMVLLLHGIPREVMAALLLGTVAVVFHPSRPKTERPSHYNGDGPGVYVAQISVAGRQGRGLNRRETKALMDLLNQYVLAYNNFERYEKEGTEPRSTQEKSIAQQAASIDSRFGIKPAGMHRLQPRFISGKLGRMRVQELINVMSRRCAVVAGDEHEDGEAWQVSLPSMIGCSDNIHQRIPAYHPDPAKVCFLSYTTYTFGLVLCAVMELGLTPEVTTVPVLRIWDIGQLPAAEMLITLLASSLVSQDGYNVVQGGNKPTKLVQTKDRIYIIARCPYLHENVTKTLEELRRRQQFLELMDSVNNPGS
jgi:hypothetical protein